MSRLIFDKKDRRPIINLDDHEWTTARLKDEFFLCLVKAPNNKYYDQAKNIMFRIPLTEQFPKSEREAIPFIINLKDLSCRVQSEFTTFCKLYRKREIAIFLKHIVLRLFENLDFEYAHMSVMRKLRVKIIR